MPERQDLLGPFSGLLHELYRASHEMSADEFQQAVLALLKPIFVFESSMWGAGSVSAGGVAVHSVHLHQQPAEFIARWQEVSHEDVVAEEVIAKPGLAVRAHSASLLAPHGKRALRAFTQHFQVENALVISTPQPELGLLNWISLYRRDAERQFSMRDKTLLESLWPHLVQALTINRIVNLDRFYVSEGRRAALAISDRKGVVYHHEPGFEAVMRLEWPAWQLPRLPAEILAAMGPSLAQYRGSRIAVDSRRAGDLFFLNVRAFSPLDRLPPRAREIAKHFSRGLTHKQIARLLGLSPATVRNHLQEVYRKLDVSDKAELATLFGSGAR